MYSFKANRTLLPCFIESALALLHERENALNLSMDRSKEDKSNFIFKCVKDSERKHLISTSSTDSSEEICDQINENLALESSPQSSSSNVANLINANESDKKGFTFFYQAEDGQHIYLHNINVRMLLKEYSSLEFAPQTITAKLVEIERVSMTDVLRKRLRYLQHLPLTCEFNVVELDFSHIVSKEILVQFEDEIKKRKQNRNRKARDERRREKRIEQEENRKLGKYPQATYNLSSTDQFPVYNPDDFLSLSPPKEGLVENAGLISDDLNSNNISEASVHYADTLPPEDKSIPTTSFAQMLRVGPKNFSPVPKETKPAVVGPVPAYRDRDSDDDEGTPAPEFHQSFSDAIQAALNSVTLQDSSGNQNVSKKKKKGKKHQLLFTTSMCRNK